MKEYVEKVSLGEKVEGVEGSINSTVVPVDGDSEGHLKLLCENASATNKWVAERDDWEVFLKAVVESDPNRGKDKNEGEDKRERIKRGEEISGYSWMGELQESMESDTKEIKKGNTKKEEKGEKKQEEVTDFFANLLNA